MIALVKFIRSKKQVIELFCLIVSLPLVYLNIKLYLSDLHSKHLEEGKGLGLNVTEVASEDEAEQFSNAFNEKMKANLEKRSQVLSDVCR